MKTLKFQPGQHCSCPGLYGGILRIEIVSRTDETVSFVYDKNTSDDRSVQEVDIIVQETNILDNDLNIIEKVNIESILCWTYTSPYGDKDTHHAYYYAFDTNQLFTIEEWEGIRKNLD